MTNTDLFVKRRWVETFGRHTGSPLNNLCIVDPFLKEVRIAKVTRHPDHGLDLHAQVTPHLKELVDCILQPLIHASNP